MNEIEIEFDSMVERFNSKVRNATSIRTVLQYLVESPKIWHWSYELSGNVTKDGGYLSHRACARASDLAIHFPELVEDRRIGKFKVYRVRRENMEKINNFLEVK